MPRTVDGDELYTRDEVEAAVRAAREEAVGAAHARLSELSAQVEEARRDGAGALHRARGLAALTGAGVTAAAAEALLELPVLSAADFTTPAGAQQALAALTATFPALFPAAPSGRPSLAPLGGVGGSPRPTDPAPDLASMTMEEYITHRSTQKG